MITTSPHPAIDEKRIEDIKTFFRLIHRGITPSNVVVHCYTLEEATTAINAIHWHGFNSKRIARYVKNKIWGDIMDFFVGFEGSPVIYVWLPFWLSQCPNGKAKMREIPDSKVKEIYQVVHVKDRDELDIKDDHPFPYSAAIAKRVRKITGDRRVKKEEKDFYLKQFNKYFARLGACEIDRVERVKSAPHPASMRAWWD